MTLWTLAAICIGLFVAGIVTLGLLLWLACLVFRVGEFSFRGILALTAALYAISLASTAIAHWIDVGLSAVTDDPAASLWLSLLATLAMIVASCWVTKRLLRIGTGRAIGIFLSTAIGNTIVALVFAFALQATVAEAFLIPTGGMAPTIRGQHVDVQCPDCGKPFPVGLSAGTLSIQVNLQRERARCLNCGFHEIPISDDHLQSGDRILVDKTIRDPQRWQMAVFVPPVENLGYRSNTPSNVKFVKRIVGMPGEELEILDGDVFIDGQRLRKPPGEVEDLWLPVNDSAHPVDGRLADRAVWRSEPTENNQWRADGGWECRTTDEYPSAVVHYAGPTVDHYDYNLRDHNFFAESIPRVRDWRITVTLQSIAGEGVFGFHWSDGEQRVSCMLEADGDVALANVPYDVDAPLSANAKTSGPLKHGAQITFAIRDGQAYLLVDGRLVKAIDVGASDLDAVKAVDVQFVEESFGFGFACHNCDIAISRIQVHRDVHYRTLREMDARMFEFQQSRWKLAGGEHFFLGDNSPNSQDARFFGPTKRDAIVGVAKWIYWPPDRWRELP